MEKKISWIIYLILSLVIVRHIIAIFTNLLMLSMTDNSLFVIANIAISIILIVSLALVMMKQRMGIYSFVGLQILSATFNSIINGDFFIHFGVAFLMCGLLFLILQIREQGISAWKVIMNKIDQQL